MWRTSLSALATTVGIFGLSTLAVFLVGFRGQGQQPTAVPGVASPATNPETPPLTNRTPTPTASEDPVPLSLDTPPAIGVDLSRDPIFQELKKAFLSKDNPAQKPPVQEHTFQERAVQEPILGTFAESRGTMVPGSAAEISEATWQAAEHLLSAARILQSEEVRMVESKDIAGLEKTRQSIRTIRETVRSLLK